MTFIGNCNIPTENDNWNVGTGASMYVNATQEPWNKHYQMYTYITEELYKLIQNNFSVIQDKISIMGHRLFLFIQICINEVIII